MKQKLNIISTKRNQILNNHDNNNTKQEPEL